mgnify:CR=1 FL=1
MCAKLKKDPMQTVLDNIDKSMGNKYGSPIFSRFKDIKAETLPVIPFGIPEIDGASYCGGVPRGKMIEIFGPESSGKSLLTLHLIASAQKNGEECALLDVEQSFDPIWAARHGVDVNNLVYSNTFESGEQALEAAYHLCKSGEFALVVIDSTAALSPKSELEGSLEKNAVIGEQARLMSRGCRKIISACAEGNTTCVFINQVRVNVGVMYGNPETTPGGKALKFYSHQRIRVASKAKIKAGEDVVGQTSSVVFVKNKTARPFGKCEFSIVFDKQSLNPTVMLAKAAKDAKIIKTYSGTFRIYDVESKPIITETASFVELADYMVKNNLVIPVIDELYGKIGDEIDGKILELKNDPSLIHSPLEDDDASMQISRMPDASDKEVGDDALADEDEPPKDE